ncbi:MTRF1L release factor glutamine methyltransferase isoform X1 [Dermacentor andersoni]|uniref:MTRF1L release factor glutamine methyltransferase isoform X1 n=3 Tax=Dermacentor andersoni TaxID=34620 RepID=UPI003B3A70BC
MRQACSCSAVQFTNYWMRMFSHAGIEPGEAKASLNCFFSSVLGRVTALKIQARPESVKRILPRHMNRLNFYCQRRAQRLPVQYILGEWTFHGLPLKMCPPIFIPRPETEALVDIVLSHINRSDSGTEHVLDVGCGTGAICLALASRTTKVHYTGIDKNLVAVKLAKENASQLGLSKRVSCYVAEVTPTGLRHLEPQLMSSLYDAIVSNPPYIATQEYWTIEPEVLRHEDHAALFAGIDGLDVVRSILQLSKTLLKVGGHLFIEVGLSQPPLIQAMLTAPEYSQMFKLLAVHPDFTSRLRFVEIKRIK